MYSSCNADFCPITCENTFCRKSANTFMVVNYLKLIICLTLKNATYLGDKDCSFLLLTGCKLKLAPDECSGLSLTPSVSVGNTIQDICQQADDTLAMSHEQGLIVYMQPSASCGLQFTNIPRALKRIARNDDKIIIITDG